MATMKFPPSLEGDDRTRARKLIEGLRPLGSNARWAIGLCWATRPGATAGVVALHLLQGVTPGIGAIAAKKLIDGAVAATSSGGDGFALLVPWLIVGFFATIADGLSRQVLNFFQRRLHEDLDLDLNTRILEHASHLELGFFEDPAREDVLYRAKQAPASNLVHLVSGSLGTLSSLIQVTSLFVIVTFIEPLTVLVVIPAAIPYLRFQWRLSRHRYELERSRATKRRWTQYFVAELTDARSVPEARILDLSPLLVRRFRDLTSEFRDQDRALEIRSLRAAASFSAVATIAIYALFARVAARVMSGTATIGDIAIFGTAAARLRSTVESEIRNFAGLVEATLSVSDLRDLLETATREPDPAPGAASQAAVRGAIELDHVSFQYPGSATTSLVDLSFRIEPGEVIALVGENGSGKTTLAKLLAGFYAPSEGCIRIGGKDLRELDPDYLRSQISFVFQNFGQYEASVAENVAYGDWRRLLDDAAGVRAVTAAAGVDDLIRTLPMEEQTVVGRRFGHFDLSRGQWQRIAIARAFARQAAILILDEPTASLDPLTEADLFRRFRSLRSRQTTILISHRFSTVRVADRIIVMERGRIAEMGTHDELVALDGVYAHLFDRATGESSGARAAS